MNFLAPKNKQVAGKTLLRSFGSALVAVVIAVNVFGAFAVTVSAQTSTTKTFSQYIDDAKTANAEAVRQAEIAKAPGTSVDGATAAATAAQAAQSQMRTALAQANLAINGLPATDQAAARTQYASTYAAVTGSAGTAVTDAFAAANDKTTAAGTAAQQAALQQAAAAAARNTTATTQAGNNGNGGAPPTQETTASHPIDICLKTKILSMCVASIFYVFFVDLTSPIAYLAGAVFDAFASISLESGTYASGVIAKGWVIARDVANMAFVFILIYVAFMLILNLEGPGIARQVAGVIAVALLINFSFFFSRVVIDMSNILAHEFYDQIVAAPSDAKPSVLVAGVQAGAQASGIEIKSISEKVMAGINPQQLLSNDNFTKFLNGGTFVGNLAILITLFLIFGIINVILAAVFLTAAFQFLTRIVALWFAIILSPIAFISFITPKMSGIWSSWVKLILKNAFYAPAFLFVIYIAIKMLDGGLLSADISSFLGGSATQAGAGAGGMKLFLNQIVGVILRLSIIVGLFIAALKVGEFIGVQSADRAEKWGKSLAASGNGALVGGLGGLAGRKTLGWAGGALAQTGVVKNWASRSEVMDKNRLGASFVNTIAKQTSIVGRGVQVASNKVATSSFDIRGTKLISAIPGASDAGKAQSGGYKKDIEDRTKYLEGLEHDRHSTPEEKEARKNAIKLQTNYAESDKAIKERLTAATEDEARSLDRIAELQDKILEAESTGNNAAKITAQQQLANERRAQRDAARRKVGETKTLKELNDNLDAKVNEPDKTRKAATATMYESKGVHNLFGILQNKADYRAAANLRASKDKNKAVADAVKDLIGETPAAPAVAPTPTATPAAPRGGGGNHGGGGGHAPTGGGHAPGH